MNFYPLSLCLCSICPSVCHKLVSIYNNRIVKMSCHPHSLCGRTVGMRQARVAGGEGAFWLRAGIEGSGGGGQAKIAMPHLGRGLRGRTDGRAQAISPQSGVTACSTKVTECSMKQIALHSNPRTMIFWSRTYSRNSKGLTPQRGCQIQVGWVKIDSFLTKVSPCLTNNAR